ncbi:MAG: ComF family protein [Candidatus Delongbacteria bacterium]|nr:ComF family protein [Candidatus Delongbacteria bacterium]MCG2761193.1 ComF family protein [Candidatus Delongbacteria bacterium]
MKFFFKTSLLSILDFLFPPVCLVCGEYLNDELFICEDCLKNLELHKNESKSSVSVFSYNDKIKILIHELKYNNRPEIGYILGKEIGKKLIGLLESDNSVLFPIPLHKKRLKKRGYNQSEKICEGLSEIINIPIKKDLLVRRINNISQTKLNALMRMENVKGIFETHSTDLDKNTLILIVDDLITTGATTKEAISELKRNGFLNYFALSVATSSK